MNAANARRELPRPRGFTLLELLICVAIMLSLTVVSVGFLADPRRSAEVREAARAVHVILDRARQEARGSGKSVGVMFERLGGLPQASATLYLAESRGIYAGDTVSARIWVGGAGLARLVSGDRGWVSLLRPGDLIRFNYRGPLYALRGYDLDGAGRFSAASHPWGVAAESGAAPVTPATGVPFQVFLQPTKAAAAPVQLLGQAVIDLGHSGTSTEFGLSGFSGPVTIVFSPSGCVERVFFGETSTVPRNPLYLLVGKREHVADGFASDSGILNWQAPGSYWVRIDPATGQVSVAECAAVPPELTGYAGIFGSRRLATLGNVVNER